METEYKIKGVIFARNWYNAVRPGLLPSDRLQFYDAVFGYAFDGTELQGMAPAAKMAFDMVKPFIDQDIVKYRERCERNRRNAQSKKPLAPSGTQSLPVADNTNTNNNTNTNINTNNNNNTISLSEEREKFLICGLFYARGALRPAEEMERFWQYYDSLGWRNNKGAPITKKSAAAKMWTLQSGISKQALAPRANWVNAMMNCECNDLRVFDNIVRVATDGAKLHIHARDAQEFSKVVEGSCMAGLKRFATSYGCTNVFYHSAD